jgi:dTDP-4-amino-4,6-dideoxygalactose transaminase
MEFETAFSSYVGSKHACAVSNCTAALHTALLAVGVKPGNIVITVSHSFIATANCIRYCGAEPVFVDIDLETFNISTPCLSECLEKECESRSGQLFYKNVHKLTVGSSPLVQLKSDPEIGRVAALLVVHQMGMPCDFRSIIPLAKKFHLPIIEDAACAVGSEFLMEDHGPWEKIGKPHGDIACFSFHPRKLMTTGEGGMLTTDNPDYDRAFRLLRHQGMSVGDLQRHHLKEIVVEEYPRMGFNYRMTDIQAAIGMVQLKKMPAMVAKRRELAALYQKELAAVSWLTLPRELPYCKTNWQSFAVRLSDNAPLEQYAFMQYFLEHGVATRPGVMNAHEEKPFIPQQCSLKHSESARRSVVILPLFHTMYEHEIYQIIELIKNV